MKIYITKYALTEGVVIAEADKDKDLFGRDLFIITNCCNDKITSDRFFYYGEYEKNIDKALQKAEEMRLKKIILLEKQIENLKKLQIKCQTE